MIGLIVGSPPVHVLVMEHLDPIVGLDGDGEACLLGHGRPEVDALARVSMESSGEYGE